MRKESEEFAKVFEDGNPERVEMVRSLLEEAGIDCLVKNAGVQNLFALGSLGGMNPLIGVMKIYVRHEDREAAEELLAGMGSVPPEEMSDNQTKENLKAPPFATGREGFLTRLRRWMMGS